MKIRIRVIVQRFHKDVIGGAETHARRLVEKLIEDGRFSVEVVTTTAIDYSNWKSVLPEGESEEDGIKVRRFEARYSRFPVAQALLLRLLTMLRGVKLQPRWLERLWVLFQGPYAPHLPNYLADVEASTDLFLFFTYLYYPTLAGLPRVATKSLLIPTAHDESAFKMRIVSEVFKNANQVLANTEEEVSLICRIHSVPRSKIKVGAVGIEVKPELVDKFQPPNHVLFFAGRIGPSKGVDKLIRALREINCSRQNPYELRLAGRLEDGFRLPSDDWLHYLGQISQNALDEQLKVCLAVVNPSEFESLSLLALEALASGNPLVVNNKCPVLRRYCDASPLAFGYSSTSDLAKALVLVERLHSDKTLFIAAQIKTIDWISERWSWSNVTTHLYNLANLPRSLSQSSGIANK